MKTLIKHSFCNY